MTLIRALLPDHVAAAESYTDLPGLQPMPEEAALIAHAVAKRRNDFLAARHCARLAMADLGLPPSPILKGDKGEPCWPDGVVGSLTHTQGYRGAVVARVGEARSVGIDAEPHHELPEGVLESVTLPIERHEIAALPDDLHWDRILFCAKEATYKAWYPLTQRWLGFEDAHITFTVDGHAAGTFTSRILIDPAARHGPPLTTLTGRWTVADGFALTAIVL